ncbi:hypothetical protein SELMODRAFT_421844 [Selaginella moellendorffii]|uniref:Uncharacterized protein n=1 Tax=Selaginella moellendorffii TaxID=88036 RepID=D8SGJ2_SELML|nr:hypothetical protein SELMODRAFT_421844 [Selaginella moellendorffii]
MPHWQDWESVLLQLGLSEAQYKGVFCDNIIQQLLAKGSINAPPSIVKDLCRNWATTQQLRELFDTAAILYCKFSLFCIEKAMLQSYKFAHTYLRLSHILIAPNNEFSYFQFAFNTNLCTPNYKVVYASEIGGALVWETESTRKLFVLGEGTTYWHPRMLVHSRMLRQEERDVVSRMCTIATLAIATGEVPNKND